MANPVSVTRILVVVAVIIGLIIAIPLVIALFVDNDFSVEREVIIERPADEVFDYIKYLKNQDEYSKWSTMDPDMKQEYRGVDGTVGFVSAWHGNDEVGRGEQEITEIMEGERINTTLRFYEPFESTAYAYMITESLDENRTRVIWGFDSSMPYPMNLLLVLMNFDEAIGDDYAFGLERLKEILESQEPVEEELGEETVEA